MPFKQNHGLAIRGSIVRCHSKSQPNCQRTTRSAVPQREKADLTAQVDRGRILYRTSLPWEMITRPKCALNAPSQQEPNQVGRVEYTGGQVSCQTGSRESDRKSFRVDCTRRTSFNSAEPNIPQKPLVSGRYPLETATDCLVPRRESYPYRPALAMTHRKKLADGQRQIQFG